MICENKISKKVAFVKALRLDERASVTEYGEMIPNRQIGVEYFSGYTVEALKYAHLDVNTLYMYDLDKLNGYQLTFLSKLGLIE